MHSDKQESGDTMQPDPCGLSKALTDCSMYWLLVPPAAEAVGAAELLSQRGHLQPGWTWRACLAQQLAYPVMCF